MQRGCSHDEIIFQPSQNGAPKRRQAFRADEWTGGRGYPPAIEIDSPAEMPTTRGGRPVTTFGSDQRSACRRVRACGRALHHRAAPTRRMMSQRVALLYSAACCSSDCVAAVGIGQRRSQRSRNPPRNGRDAPMHALDPNGTHTRRAGGPPISHRCATRRAVLRAAYIHVARGCDAVRAARDGTGRAGRQRLL